VTGGLDSRQKAQLILQAARDKKAEDVIALDVRGLSSFTDTFLIATGNSDRHVRSIVDGIEAALGQHGERPIGVEGREEGRWVLIDLNDAVVHVFQREVRAHYGLERLWGDAPELELAPPPPGVAESGAS
jgi:ribosome-associated protein